MAASYRKTSNERLIVVALTLLMALAPGGHTAVAAQAVSGASRSAPITVDAASTEVDYRSNAILLRDVTISQGDIRVQATEARAAGGLNFQNSRWTFSGNVRIRAEGGSLRSDQAVISFANNTISRATITGKPAEFEQARGTGADVARGRAETIIYETAAGTVSLQDSAWLSDGRNEIRGQRLVYNIREQRVQARSQPNSATGNQGRVRIIIQPGEPADTKPDAATPKAAPVDPAP
ncbi:MAG: lipopolysaccharide transport periplasmic protein LptA [Steroidobacteraceae bacterium]